MRVTVGAAQFTPKKADVEANLDRMAEWVLQAQDEGLDLIAFPESATTAYYLEGGVLECSLTREQLFDGFQKRLAGKLTRPLDALVGFYEAAENHLYNSAAYLQLGPDGRIVHVYRKFFLPTYGIFDEDRFVARGTELGVFDTRLGRMGILICEDAWHSILATLLALNGAQILLVPSASPGRGFEHEVPSNVERYGRMLRAACEEHAVFAVNVHLCGFEGGKGFVGKSSILDPYGNTVAESPLLDDHLLVAELDLDQIQIARAQLPLLPDLDASWDILLRIAEGTGP